MSGAEYRRRLSIITIAGRLLVLKNTARSRIVFELRPTEVVDFMICTNDILMVLRDSVELGNTEVDRSLVECIEMIDWLHRVVKDQLQAGGWMGAPVVRS